MAETRPTHDGRRLRAPFLIVNPKAYLYGAESLELAIDCEDLAANHDVDVVYTAQQADVRMIAARCPSLFVAAQHMDALVPGRGMGFILPEALVEAGARAVVLNHAEHPMGVHELSVTIDRYDSNEPVLGAAVEVESDGMRAAAQFHADHGDYASEFGILEKARNLARGIGAEAELAVAESLIHLEHVCSQAVASVTNPKLYRFRTDCTYRLRERLVSNRSRD